MSGKTEDVPGLPSFEEFMNPDAPAGIERVLDELAPYVESVDADTVASFYVGDVPGSSLSEQAQRLAQDLPDIDEAYDSDRFDHDSLNALYGIAHQVSRGGETGWVPEDLLDHQDDMAAYDTIVLDHSPICRMLGDEAYRYTDREGEDQLYEAAELIDAIDDIAETADLYVPSDLREKFSTADSAPIQYAMIDHLEAVGTPYDIDRDVDVPSQHQHMSEDYGIASAADDLPGETAILAFDGDFVEIEEQYDIDAVIPELPSY
ncbi:MAG: hypothetical protein MUP66_03365 [Candidatus Nanohaloarchaeota archaeon QJJ-5]|nr:hypothetical protein [Candidatus Nanohaloarchaeota archaeon QJJ-5]